MSASADAHQLADDLRAVVWGLVRMQRVLGETSELSLAQQGVLRRLQDHEGMTGAELARAEQVRPQSMSAHITHLRELGLVEANASPRDGRVRLLRLTPRGREVIAEITGLRRDDVAERLSQRLDQGQREQLAASIQLLRGLLDEHRG